MENVLQFVCRIVAYLAMLPPAPPTPPSKSGKRPFNVPGQPCDKYRNTGWVSWPDYLGYVGQRKCLKGTAMPFAKARAFVHTLKIKRKDDWHVYTRKSGAGEAILAAAGGVIPSSPNLVYRNTGWVSWSDWLGYAPQLRVTLAAALPIDEARVVVWKLRLSSLREWEEYVEQEETSGTRTSHPLCCSCGVRSSVCFKKKVLC